MAIREQLHFKNIGYKEHNKRKVYRKPGDCYMSSVTAMRLLLEIVAEIRETERCQQAVNSSYLRLVDFINTEAERSVIGKDRNRKHTKFKP